MTSSQKIALLIKGIVGLNKEYNNRLFDDEYFKRLTSWMYLLTGSDEYKIKTLNLTARTFKTCGTYVSKAGYTVIEKPMPSNKDDIIHSYKIEGLVDEHEAAGGSKISPRTLYRNLKEKKLTLFRNPKTREYWIPKIDSKPFFEFSGARGIRR